MNNRFVKNNIGLVAVTSICLLIAVIELGFVVVYSLSMYANITTVKDLSNKIRTITRKRPVPVPGNKAPIEADIKVYEDASNALFKMFGRPLTPAVARFFEVLTLRKSMWMQDFDIDENDEMVKQLLQRISGRTLADLDNREFEEHIEWLSAAELAKKIKELSPDDEKTKLVRDLVPDLDKLDAAALTKVIFDAAALSRVVTDVELPAAELAKQLKALPADSEAAKPFREQIPDLDKLDAAALAEKIESEPELNRKLQTMFAVPALAKRLKELPADGETAKRLAELVPDLAKLDDTARAARVFAMATLDKRLRELIPDSEPETLAKMRRIPAHFNAGEFLDKYRKMLEGVEEKNYADRQRRFDDFRRARFENWVAARAAFIRALGQGTGPEDQKIPLCVVEKFDIEHVDNADNADEVLLSALGIPRVMDGESDNLKRLIDNIVTQLTEKYQIKLAGRALGLGIVSEASNTEQGGGQNENVDRISRDDYPAVATHLDIIGYMLYRVGSAKVTVWDVQIRLKSSEGDEASGGRSFNDSKDQRDGFDIYHYTIEIEGTMAQIREAVRLLDDCYAVRRVYVIKNIAMYAKTNIIDSRFTGITPEEREQQNAQQSRPSDANQGRRRRYAAEGGGDAPSGLDEQERQREQAKLDAEYMAAQKKLKPVQRDGYGELITADGDKETFQAVIDVEYVVKPAND